MDKEEKALRLKALEIAVQIVKPKENKLLAKFEGASLDVIPMLVDYDASLAEAIL